MKEFPDVRLDLINFWRRSRVGGVILLFRFFRHSQLYFLVVCSGFRLAVLIAAGLCEKGSFLIVHDSVFKVAANAEQANRTKALCLVLAFVLAASFPLSRHIV